MNEVRLRRRARKKISEERGWGGGDAGVQRGECKHSEWEIYCVSDVFYSPFFAVPLTMLLSTVLGVWVIIERFGISKFGFYVMVLH